MGTGTGSVATAYKLTCTPSGIGFGDERVNRRGPNAAQVLGGFRPEPCPIIACSLKVSESGDLVLCNLIRIPQSIFPANDTCSICGPLQAIRGKLDRTRCW